MPLRDALAAPAGLGDQEQQRLGRSGINAALNPVTGQDHDVIDLTTGILDGSVSFMFANGETLFGNQHVVGLDTSSQTQMLTFSGGTGEFANATGSA